MDAKLLNISAQIVASFQTKIFIQSLECAEVPDDYNYPELPQCTRAGDQRMKCLATDRYPLPAMCQKF